MNERFVAVSTVTWSRIRGRCSKPRRDFSHYLWLSIMLTCVVPWTKTGLCDTSFTATGPRLWNMLLASLHLVDNYIRSLCIC